MKTLTYTEHGKFALFENKLDGVIKVAIIPE